MARRLPQPSDDDRRLWTRVTRTITPQAPVKSAYIASDSVEAALAEMSAYLGDPPPEETQKTSKVETKSKPASQTTKLAIPPRTQASISQEAAQTAAVIAGMLQSERARIHGARPAPEELEPRRQRRLSRERDPIDARIDLHGFGRFEAEDQLRGFLMHCQSRDMRAVLVITGQGRRGGGVIRASIIEWLASPHLRHVVSGFASAHRRHGGDGAFYVTLRQR